MRSMMVGRERKEGHRGSDLPFGYYLERDADLLILHRPDGTFLAAFSARGADIFEVEATVWEDAPWHSARSRSSLNTRPDSRRWTPAFRKPVPAFGVKGRDG